MPGQLQQSGKYILGEGETERVEKLSGDVVNSDHLVVYSLMR